MRRRRPFVLQASPRHGGEGRRTRIQNNSGWPHGPIASAGTPDLVIDSGG